MLDYALLSIFIPTFLLISATPGMCMTLALTLGMTIGIRKTLWMVWGELLGVALVSVTAVIGIASVMLNYPVLFKLLKYVGGGYLVYIGIQHWLSTTSNIITPQEIVKKYENNEKKLMLQGFITAIANPKGWAFAISLLPAFINPKLAIAPQLTALVIIILFSEFTFLVIYAAGGKSLGKLLSHNSKLMNRLSGTLMAAIGIWLAMS